MLLDWRNKRRVSAFTVNESLHHAATCHYHSKVHGTLKFSLKLAQLMALLVSLTWTISAQQTNDPTRPPFNPAAYRVGEHLTYNVGYAHFVSAAHVELFVAARGKFFNRDGIQLRGHVETTGMVNVALFAINNDYTTYVDAQTGLPFRAQQIVRGAGGTTEASRDYNQPARADATPAKPQTGEFPGPYDLLSALYRVRAMPLTHGSSYFFTVFHEGEQYQAEAKVTGRQIIKTNVGSFNTIVTRINLKNSRDYDIRVYFSSDESHVPVLVTAKPPSGEIRAELAGSELETPARAPSNTGTNPIQPTRPRPQDPPITIGPATPGGAQPSASPTDRSGQAPLDLPFKVGEELNYQVYLGAAAQPVGNITFAVRARGRYFNRDGLLFSATARTSSAGARIFLVNDQVNSYVDPTTLLPFRTELNLSEGKYRANLAYNLDQNRGTVVGDNRERIEIPVGTHDVISLLYAIRTFDLAPLKRNAISILTNRRPRTLFITSQRRETIDLNGQKIPAILLTLTTDDAQADQMQIRIWVGDDNRHLPLRIAAVTELGPVRADLAVSPTTPR